MYREEGTGASFALGLCAGALIGAGLALLFAPKTGQETRQLLGEQYRGVADRVNDATQTIREQARERGQQIATQLSDRFSTATERMTSSAERAAAAASPTGERISSSVPSV